MNPPRGFAAIALVNPKTPANVGGVMRAAGCYSANFIAICGARRMKTIRGLSTDVQKTWRHIPTIEADDPFDVHPVGAVPIAVDLLPGAIELPAFIHPERAYYIFGPEDGTVPSSIVRRCAVKLVVPTAFCMNLAATVNVVLYDRMAKNRMRKES